MYCYSPAFFTSLLLSYYICLQTQDSSIAKQNVVNEVSEVLVKGLGMPEGDLSLPSAEVDAFADQVRDIYIFHFVIASDY